MKKRRREPRRAAKSASLLSLERRVQEAVKIIGGGRAQRADVEEIVDHMSKQCEWWKWDTVARIHGSKGICKAIRSRRCARSSP